MGFNRRRRLEMNETFPEFLNGMQADPDMIQQALRMYISERTDDLTSKEMLAELRQKASSEEDLDHILEQLQQDPDALEQAALFYFDRAWESAAQRQSIRAAFEHAKSKLPVVELAILAVVAMYAMYLDKTDGGIRRRTIKRRPNGSYEVIEEREPFAPIVSAWASLFGKR